MDARTSVSSRSMRSPRWPTLRLRAFVASSITDGWPSVTGAIASVASDSGANTSSGWRSSRRSLPSGLRYTNTPARVTNASARSQPFGVAVGAFSSPVSYRRSLAMQLACVSD